MGILTDHARRELEIMGEESETIEGYIRVIEAFEEMGHCGGSQDIAALVVHELLNLRNLRPLTDNPAEWTFHDKTVAGGNGIWQNLRNTAAFSKDGGKTFYFVTDVGYHRDEPQMHNSIESGI